MKKCIWCNKNELLVSFHNEAHTIPKSLGGNKICTSVCDACNAYFGMQHNGLPSIEFVLKETLNISRIRFLDSQSQIGKNKPLAKISSHYFSINLKKRKIILKSAFKLQKGLQEKLAFQLRRGMYKIFLEEIERQTGDGHNPKYDFIREFSRYGFGDYPLFYFRRLHGIIPMALTNVVNPEFFLEKEYQSKYLIDEPQFFEFELLGHLFGIVKSKIWRITYEEYLKKTVKEKEKFFHKPQSVKQLTDVDILLSILDEPR